MCIVSAPEKPRDPRDIAAADRSAAWRAERVRLGHAVDENGCSLLPVSRDPDAVPGRTLSERNMRRMAAADRIAFPQEWDREA